jgi:UDP-N-acetylmuramoyl-L-alanyl-D-glutamate--2,6-diaminopimelate ligase
VSAQAATALGWRLSRLLAGFGAVPPAAERLISRIAVDAREAGPDALFIAACGSDEAQIHAAAARGCAAIVAEAEMPPSDVARADPIEAPLIPVRNLARISALIAARFYGEPSTSTPLLGLAGAGDATNLGHLLAQALADERCGLISALGSGLPGELDPGVAPPRDPLQMQHRLAALKASGARVVAMPLDSDAPSRLGLDAVNIELAVLTGPTATDATAERDARRPDAALPALATAPSLRWVIVDHDHAGCRAFASEAARGNLRHAGYSLDPEAVLSDYECWARATDVTALPHGLAIDLETSAGHASVEFPLLGRGNASDLLAVICVLLARGRDLSAVLSAMRRVRGVPGRMEAFGDSATPLVVVDAAQSPPLLARAIDALRAHRNGRLITVLGCNGARDRELRARIGATAERLSDQLIITDDNPGQEDGGRIIADILAGMAAPQHALIERQRGLAIRRAIAIAGTEDTILIAGKGHATTQDMGELKVRFSDRAQVVQALCEWR